MTEQQITMLAIRYLAQICEAIGDAVRAGRAENEVSAWHCMNGCLADIQKISLNSQLIQERKHRLFYIRDAMLKLKITRERQTVLAESSLPLPSVSDLDALRIACTGARSQ